MRSLYYLVWVSLLSLLVAPTVLAEEFRSPLAPLDTRSPLAPLGKGGTGLKVPLVEGKTAVKVPLLKGDLGGSLAQNSQQALTRVTGVEVKQTPTGLQIILKTPPRQAKLVPLILPEGNNLLVEILDATLAFGIRNGVTKTNPAPGISQVKVAKIDATSVRVTITGTTQQPPTAAIVSGGQNLVLNVTPKATAQTKPEQEIEIVVTGQREEDNYAAPNSSIGTRTDTPIKDVPQSIQVVPRQVIEDQGETNFTDALRSVSGVAQEGSGSIKIRGFSGFDSVRRNGADAGLNSGAQNFSLADVEQIEVLKGPAAVLYGSGEPGGVINITTKQPETEPSYELQGIIGNFDFYRPSLDITGPLNEDKTILYRFSAFYENSGSFVDFVKNEEFGFFPVLSFELGKNTTLTLEGNYRKDTSNDSPFVGNTDGLPIRGTLLPNPLGEIPRSRYTGEPDFNDASFTEWNIGYRLEHQFNDNLSIKNSFTANIIDRNGLVVRPDVLLEDNRTLTRIAEEAFGGSKNYTLQTDLLGKVRTGIVQHDLLLGVELARNNNETTFLSGEAASLDIFNPVYGNLPNPDELELEFGDRSTDDTIGVYAQDLLSIGEKVKFVVGGRFDWNFSEFTDFTTLESGEIGDGETIEEDPVSSFSPRVGIVYQPIEPVSLYSSYSTFFLPEFGTDRLNNPFEPVTGRQFEVGVKGEFFDGRASATLAAFQINRRNDLLPDPVDPDNFEVQLGETRSRGIEFDLTGEILPGLKLITTYALTDNQITEDDNFGTEGNRPADVPLHSGSIWAVYEVQKGNYRGFGVGTGVFAVGERQGNLDNTVTVPAYGRVDGLLYYRRENWQAQLNFENLLNEDYFESGAENSAIFGAPFTVRGQLSAEF
jgi:iron complex outermembrane recepter protein